jgi:hypothetical protein
MFLPTPNGEEPIKDANELGVRLYLDLTNTKGLTGNFTKLGISGLPLATIFLTCFFSILGLSDGANRTTFLDLAKLTLGAFIGSFVQRQAERDRNPRLQLTPNDTGRPINPQGESITGKQSDPGPAKQPDPQGDDELPNRPDPQGSDDRAKRPDPQRDPDPTKRAAPQGGAKPE